jgi:hypothetical protein
MSRTRSPSAAGASPRENWKPSWTGCWKHAAGTRRTIGWCGISNMNGSGCSMHEFSVGQRRFGRPDPEDRLMGILSVENERTVRLSGLLGRVGSKAIYTYDFGDSWEHSIVLEKRLPVDQTMTYPVCTDGQLACPPEDCGGISGFYDLVEALHDPTHERHEEMLDWIGDFDPQAFSVDDANRMLTPLRRRQGKASKR